MYPRHSMYDSGDSAAQVRDRVMGWGLGGEFRDGGVGGSRVGFDPPNKATPQEENTTLFQPPPSRGFSRPSRCRSHICPTVDRVLVLHILPPANTPCMPRLPCCCL